MGYAIILVLLLSPTLVYAEENDLSAHPGTDSAGVVDSAVAGSVPAARGLPSSLGPLDYVPASPSDELREEVGRPAPTLEEVPTQQNLSVPNDNAA